MKIMFQELCTQKVNWDQELHGDTLLKWNSFLTQLESLNNVRISQYYFQANIKPSSIQLRGFSDASKQAYAAVVYLRSSHDDGHVKVSVVSSKPQSCPSETTINPSPRIAGDMHFGATDGQSVQRSMPQEIQKFYWTNSKTALSWIMNEKPWKQYLNHRVLEIRTLTGKDEWNYRKWPCISYTFFHKIEAKNQGCGLSMDTSVFGGLKP